MQSRFQSLALVDLLVDVASRIGPSEWWRHTLSHGGMTPLPLPAAVVEGVKRIEPRLIRVFVQEYFTVYGDGGALDWSRLDRYMDALERTGARIVAAITLKPPALFPTIDHSRWQPSNREAWQKLIFELVRRYSVERALVTHWEVANEPDIGEHGGTPYLIPDASDYHAFYDLTISAILAAFPNARVGGPAVASVDNQLLPGFVEHCRLNGTQLDFISWHLYSDDPARHARGVVKAHELLAVFGAQRPELLVTEWSDAIVRHADRLDPSSGRVGRTVSVAEQAFDPRRAAIVAASIMAMHEVGVDWTFYYHVWDHAVNPEDFRPFFSRQNLRGQLEFWNETPHRFGLFAVGEEVRPQYFVFQMLSRLGADRIAARSPRPDLRVVAARDEHQVSACMTNFDVDRSQDCIAAIRFQGLEPGRKLLNVFRIDGEQRWSNETLELQPVERREVYTETEFGCQMFLPADSVACVRLENLAARSPL